MTHPSPPDTQAPGPEVDFKGGLNAAQRKAVESVEGAYLVVAGAGTGKTRTLVYRVANLVLRGVPPESILLLTFTRRAAQEMIRRATRVLDDRCGRVAGGTFHSFANLALRRYAKLLGYESNFTILDRADASDMMGVVRAESGFAEQGQRFARKDTLIDMISKVVNTGRSIERVLKEDYPQFVDDLEAITELEKRYRSRKRKQCVMDYDDLLLNLRQLLVEHEKVRHKVAATYRYLMLDEYQDTNRLQAHIAALLASGHGNVMVVGDDAQSIYSFRGAHFKNIMDFPQIFPDSTTILLEQNYRSTQPILDLGNAIMTNARQRFTKELYTEVSGGQKPHFVRTTDDYTQASFICQRVLELREEGVPLAEIAVLSRAAWHTNSLELELKKRNIPFRKFGGIKFVEAAHVKDVSAFLKLSLNPRDTAAWFRLLQLCSGIGPKIAQRLGQSLAAADGDFSALGLADRKSKRYGEELGRLDKVLRGLKDPALGVGERFERAVDFYRSLMPKKYDDVDRRVRDLEAVQLIADRYASLDAFLSDLAIEPPEVGREPQGHDPDDEWMTVSTIHSAKGLEWNTVFIVNLNAGQFPVYRGQSDPEDFEEERRLFYVAVTRAKENLYLLKPEQIPRRGAYAEGIAELSPLIWEIRGFDELVDCETFAPEWDEPWLDDGEETSRGHRFDHIQSYFETE